MKLNGRMVCLWRAVDQEGEVLESYITTTRDKAAALTVMKKASKRHGSRDDHPHGLRSYNAAMSELGCEEKQEVGRPGSGHLHEAWREKSKSSCEPSRPRL